MKRWNLLLFATALILMLSGCASIDGYLESKMEKQSGIETDTNYQTYQSYIDEGNLDPEGYYREDVFESEGTINEVAEVPENASKVTFSTNGYLNIQYYKDAKFSVEIDSNDTILGTGDCIYATVSLDKSVPSSTYTFAGFRLSEIDEDGSHFELDTLNLGEDGLVLKLPEQYAGKDLAIDPLGTYETRQVSLMDSYIDNEENEHNLSGTWIVNDKPISGHVAEINPVSSYIISYEFDGNEYFYLSSEPECFYSNNDDGVVIFNKRESTAETVDYSVKLHQYISIDLPSAQLRHVNINNGEEKTINAGSELHIPRLKYGDKVVIVSDIKWDELQKNRDLILQSEEPLHKSGQTAYRYTLIVPQKGGEFKFDPSEYSYKHGTISFNCFGEEVTSIQYLAVGTRITYEQRTADEGYWLSEGTHTITVSTPEATRKELEGIHFSEKVQVTVQLPQPNYGGTIEYYANGSKLIGTEYKGYSGTEITMKFNPWEGWINKYINGEKYNVTSEPAQKVNIKGKTVLSAFIESDDHKPKLEVILSKSVGENMKFKFDAPGLDSNDYHYEDGWFRNDYTVISNQSIGTEKGISLSMANRAIQAGTAVKILVEMSGEDKSENGKQIINTSYYRLVDSLTDLQAPIAIYGSDNMGSSPIWYKTIRITISVVDVMSLSLPASSENGSVTVSRYDTKQILRNGDILEKAEQVTITISANTGYYVSGKNVKNNIFQTTERFDKCISDIQKIIDEHPIKKYIQVTLDSSDPYGSCVYKHNGKIVTGTINLKAGDVIILEYKISDPSYIIDGASGFLGTPIGKNEKEATKSITINDDESTLSRVDFDIKVKKEG